MPVSKRDHLVNTALELFVENGFHATGIDRILAESGVAKMTLYKHFKSKDALILAVLKRRDERFLDWFTGRVEQLGSTPRERLLAVFDALGEWFSSPDFCGCLFINASAEYGRRDDPIHGAAREHKRMVFNYLRGLAAAAGADDAEDLASGFALLIEGSIVMAQVADDVNAAMRARKTAENLLKQAGV